MESLSAKVDRSRWKILRHVLGRPITGPAYSSPINAVNTVSRAAGKTVVKLFSFILHDFSVCKMCLNNLPDLNYPLHKKD